MVDLMYCLTNLIFFVLIMYYINKKSSRIFCRFCGNIYFPFAVSIYFSSIYEAGSRVLPAIMLTIKSSVASAAF